MHSMDSVVFAIISGIILIYWGIERLFVLPLVDNVSDDFDFIVGTSQIWGFVKDKKNRPPFIFAVFGGLLMAAATYFDLVTYLQWVLLVALGSIFYGIPSARRETREIKEMINQSPHVLVGHGDKHSAETKRKHSYLRALNRAPAKPNFGT